MTMTQPGGTLIKGVATAAFLATLDAVKNAPEAAQFVFRVENTWMSGPHSQSRVAGFCGVGEEQQWTKSFMVAADHPEVLVGGDNPPAPAEHLLAALAACLAAGIGNIAAARKVRLTKVASTVEGQIDLNGILGLSEEVRNGFSDIGVCFEIEGDATAEKLAEIVEQSKARSAVFDGLTNGVSGSVEVSAP